MTMSVISQPAGATILLSRSISAKLKLTDALSTEEKENAGV